MKWWQLSEAGQERHWRRANYRGPNHPVVAAYADPKLEYIRKQIPLSGKSVLDVGCGNGVFTSRLAKWARKVVGLDLSLHMLANNRHPARIRGSAAALPFRSQTFDVVFEANLLHHVEDPEATIRELGRCSAQHLVLLEPNRWNPLMFGLSLAVSAERGVLRSSKNNLIRMTEDLGFEVQAVTVTGMISQNNTPGFLIPLLKAFDGEFFLGEYIILCAESKKRRPTI